MKTPDDNSILKGDVLIPLSATFMNIHDFSRIRTISLESITDQLIH